MPKGYKIHPITKEIIPAYKKVPLEVKEINYDDILKEYYDNIKKGVLINIGTFLTTKGLTDSQIHYFTEGYLKKHPDFWEQVLNLSRQHYHSNSVQVDASLLKKCMEGDPRAIKLYYERIEGWISQLSQPAVNIQLIFSDGMISDDEKNIIELKQVAPPEIENIQKGDETPIFDIDRQNVKLNDTKG